MGENEANKTESGGGGGNKPGSVPISPPKRWLGKNVQTTNTVFFFLGGMTYVVICILKYDSSNHLQFHNKYTFPVCLATLLMMAVCFLQKKFIEWKCGRKKVDIYYSSINIFFLYSDFIFTSFGAFGYGYTLLSLVFFFFSSLYAWPNLFTH